MLKILRSLFRDEYDTYQAGRRYDIPFEVHPEDLVRLDEVARELLADTILGDASPTIDFSAKLRYADLSSDRYLELDTMLRDGGDRGDPERLTMTWSALAPNPLGATVSIEVTYVTEKPLDIEERALAGVQHSAWASVVVTGVSSRWARDAANRCGAYIKEQEIAGIYKPLHIFRHWEVAFVFGLIAGGLVRSGITSYLTQASVDLDAINASRNAFVKAVQHATSINEKLDTVIAYQYQPVEPTDLLRSLRIDAAGVMAWLATIVAALWFLPKLVPRSFIAIGLSGKRFRRYRSAFNFVVFAMVLLGIVIPVTINLLV